MDLDIIPNEILVNIMRFSDNVNIFRCWLTLCKRTYSLCCSEKLIDEMKIKFVRSTSQYGDGNSKLDIIDSFPNGFISRVKRYQFTGLQIFIPTYDYALIEECEYDNDTYLLTKYNPNVFGELGKELLILFRNVTIYNKYSKSTDLCNLWEPKDSNNIIFKCSYTKEAEGHDIYRVTGIPSPESYLLPSTIVSRDDESIKTKGEQIGAESEQIGTKGEQIYVFEQDRLISYKSQLLTINFNNPHLYANFDYKRDTKITVTDGILMFFNCGYLTYKETGISSRINFNYIRNDTKSVARSFREWIKDEDYPLDIKDNRIIAKSDVISSFQLKL